MITTALFSWCHYQPQIKSARDHQITGRARIRTAQCFATSGAAGSTPRPLERPVAYSTSNSPQEPGRPGVCPHFSTPPTLVNAQSTTFFSTASPKALCPFLASRASVPRAPAKPRKGSDEAPSFQKESGCGVLSASRPGFPHSPAAFTRLRRCCPPAGTRHLTSLLIQTELSTRRGEALRTPATRCRTIKKKKSCPNALTYWRPQPPGLPRSHWAPCCCRGPASHLILTPRASFPLTAWTGARVLPAAFRKVISPLSFLLWSQEEAGQSL